MPAWWEDATGLAELVAAGEISPVELVEAACRSIERIDPEIGAVPVRFFDEAIERARAARLEAPFAGIPFLMKDVGARQRGQPYYAANRALRDARSPGGGRHRPRCPLPRHRPGDGRQLQHPRVRPPVEHMAAGLRADAQPVGSRALGRGVLGRGLRGGRGGAGSGGPRQRRSRLDPDSGGLVWTRWSQALSRPGPVASPRQGPFRRGVRRRPVAARHGGLPRLALGELHRDAVLRRVSRPRSIASRSGCGSESGSARRRVRPWTRTVAMRRSGLGSVYRSKATASRRQHRPRFPSTPSGPSTARSSVPPSTASVSPSSRSGSDGRWVQGTSSHSCGRSRASATVT